MGGFLVEKPLHLDMNLSFDYTRSCPVAEVAFPQRLVPPGRNLKSAVSLILPESDYNRKLGIFQVFVREREIDEDHGHHHHLHHYSVSSSEIRFRFLFLVSVQ